MFSGWAVKAGVTGWDIGGANVKAVRITGGGGGMVSGVWRTGVLGTASLGTAALGTASRGTASRGTAPGGAALQGAVGSSAASHSAVVMRPFALWREPDRLAATLTEMGAEVGAGDVMGITMTAELADCFATKREGVRFVLDSFRRAFPDAITWVFGLDGSFHELEAAHREPLRVAAANWLATACWVAQRVSDALLLDIGSTTTDVVPIVRGRVHARGRTDTERLALGELVYTGGLRTPVCALVRRVPVRGGWCRVAAEHFAIAADVYLWLRRIEPAEYTCDTPDGRGTERRDAGRRLARVVCGDDESLSDDEITGIARHVAAAQRRVIATAVDEVLTRLGEEAPGRAVIAGSGYRLAAPIARRAGLDIIRLDDLFGNGRTAAAAAPAAAVAYLLADLLSCSPPVQDS